MGEREREIVGDVVKDGFPSWEREREGSLVIGYNFMFTIVLMMTSFYVLFRVKYFLEK